jgi:hypothetical protein
MSKWGQKRSGSYLNPDFIFGRATGTCCWGCAKRDDCPMESAGRRCTRDHTACEVCTWWNERGCVYFEIDRSFLKM